MQVGISEVVYNQSYSMDDQVCLLDPCGDRTWAAETPKAAAILKEGGVQLRQFSPVGRPWAMTAHPELIQDTAVERSD